jgi:peptidoglycan/xylan/chitin deacetylase (PgdA/CDA1 family)
MIGRRAAAQPDLVHDILAEGHGIGSHSFDHADFGPMSPDQMHANITQGVDAVEQAAWLHPRQGNARRLFRIPGATGVPLTPPPAWMAFLRQQNLILAGYDISPQDWRHDSPDASFKRLFTHFPDRGVIVMHDAQPPTLQLLPMVLDELRRRHAKIASLDLKNGSEPRIAGKN